MEKLSVFGFLCVFVNMRERGREAIIGLGYCFEMTPTWARPRHYGREKRILGQKGEEREGKVKK